jgi:hypothetical protein
MKTMTCDEAFEALTDPRALKQPQLERHLAGCVRCRQMRDVLAPALALFAGDAPAEPSAAMLTAAAGEAGSSTSGLLTPAAVLAADAAARRLGARSRRSWLRTSPATVVSRKRASSRCA